MTARTFGALIAAVTLFSAPAMADGAAAQQDLIGTSWHLTELAGAPVNDGISSTLVISADNVGGNGGCNGFGGELTMGADSIDISQIISTQMACDSLPQEQAYFAALEAATSYGIAAGDLILNGPNGDMLARLSPAQ